MFLYSMGSLLHLHQILISVCARLPMFDSVLALDFAVLFGVTDVTEEQFYLFDTAKTVYSKLCGGLLFQNPSYYTSKVKGKVTLPSVLCFLRCVTVSILTTSERIVVIEENNPQIQPGSEINCSKSEIPEVKYIFARLVSGSYLVF